MIGYYVHHQGRGHLHRAQSLSEVAHAELGEQVTGLSSLTRPAGWPGPWVQLPRDDRGGAVVDVTAHEQLHWVPLGDAGLRERAAAVSAWIQRARPRAVVVDVSAELAVLVRLHGVPVVSMVLPGDRTDTAHLTGFRVSSALTAAWPAEAGCHGADLTPGLPEDLRSRLQPLGAISRFACAPPGVRRPGRLRAVLLQGRGGGPTGSLTLERLHALAPQWDWRLLGSAGEWVEDPSPMVLDADVVLTSSGQGSLADVAALRRPAVVVPEDRPHGEQAAMAAALSRGDWPVVVAPSLEEAVTSGAMDRASRLDGGAWDRWCDGQGARRLASVVRSVALPPAPGD